MKRCAQVDGDEARIPLTKGYEAIIDTSDMHIINAGTWCVRVMSKNHIYAVKTLNRKQVFMHRLLMAPAKGQYVDHIDGDGLNNRRSNLRIATNAENQWNQRLSTVNKSGVKGVHFSSVRQLWVATISKHKRKYYLGSFDSLDDAANAYRIASQELHGNYGRPA